MHASHATGVESRVDGGVVGEWCVFLPAEWQVHVLRRASERQSKVCGRVAQRRGGGRARHARERVPRHGQQRSDTQHVVHAL